MSALYVFEEMRLPIELLAAVLIFLLPFAERRERFTARAVLGFAGAILLSLLFFPIFLDKDAPRFLYFTIPWYTLIALSAVGYAMLCFRISWCDALFHGISAFASQNIIYSIYHTFFARILFPSLRHSLPIYVLGTILVCAIVYVPLYFLFSPPLRQCGGTLIRDSRNSLLFYCGMFAIMLTCLFFYQAVFAARVSVYDALAWLSQVLVCVFLLAIQYSLIRGMVYARQSAMLENMLRGSEHYYELAREHIAIINRKCHDLKHQLKALELATDEERADYIREARNSVDFYQHLVYTDNEALNTILAEKGLFCQEKGIEFHCAVDEVDLSFIRLPDLYALLGNAIDNAIEYVESLSDPTMRIINLRIGQKNMFIGIQVTNPYAGSLLSPDELPKSSKADPYHHGFGLKSIRYLAKKYGGTMEFSTDNRLFSLQIMIPCQSGATAKLPASGN